MTSYLTSMDNISQSRIVFEIFDIKAFWSSNLIFEFDLRPLKVIWGRIFLYHLTAHIWLPIRLLWTPSLYLVPFSRYLTWKFLEFDLDHWPLKVIWGLICGTIRKPIYDFIFYFYEQHLPISYRFREIRLQSLQGLTLTVKVIWGQQILYYSNAHILLPIWLLWTTSLYLATFSSYSTSTFLGSNDLDLRPLTVIWGQQILYHSKAHMWLSILLLWTQSFQFVPFSRYSTWPLTPKCHLGSKFLYLSIAHIWLNIWLLWTPSLYPVPFSRYSTSKFLGFDLDFWPQKVIWGRNFYTFRKLIYDFLIDFSEQHLLISYRFRDIRLQN